jgi:L-alanine-DL-glutamate epimerase-like enolase superfamily enzyme
MTSNRRDFLKTAALGLAGTSLAFNSCGVQSATSSTDTRYTALDEALARPVLKRELFPDPVIIDRLELIRYGDNFICRVTSTDGAEGICVSNNFQMIYLYPIFELRLQPMFKGKDARDWEQLLIEAYMFRSNYKLQGLALWLNIATIEFAVLDMLGKIANLPMGALIGDIHNSEIAVYQANNFRGRSPEESLEGIRKNVYETGAKALKFKVGGRMFHDDDPPKRSETLIPMVRKAFGDDMTIYADSNGSYDVPEAIRIGKLMEEYRYDFYEEPVPFDWYEETKQVKDALKVPIAGGEQEPSMWNFRWMIGNDALDIVQPDPFYFGGMIRSMQVARMAAVKGKECTPHISGSGLGYLYMMHFVSAVPNAGPYHEFKGFSGNLPMEIPTSDLQVRDGKIKVPTGPGLGVIIDPDYIAKHKPIKL